MAHRYAPLLSLILALHGAHAYADLSAYVSVQPGICDDPFGSATAYASGGLPPYTYVWSPGDPDGQGTPTITGLAPGIYTVIVTDALGTSVQASGEVMPPGGLNYPAFAQVLYGCDNPCAAVIQLDESSFGGTPPYDYSVPTGGGANGYMMIGGICDDGTPITITDATGCSITFVAYGSWQGMSPGPEILAIIPACGAQANGAVTIGPDYGPSSYRVFNATFDSIYAFGSAPYTISGLLPGDYEVGLWDPADPMGYGTGNGWWVYCTDLSSVTIPSIPEPCGTVSGRIFHDADQDCVQGGSDLSLPYRVVAIEPGPVYGITDGHGDYLAHLDHGTYAISQALGEMVQLCPPQSAVPFTVDGAGPHAIIDFADSSTAPLDLHVSLSATVARIGHPFSISVIVWNPTIYPSGDLDINLDFDNLLGSPTPADGHWTDGPMPPLTYAATTYVLQAQIPDDVSLIGTTMDFTATVTNTEPEANTANNTATLPVEIMGPYDPNDLTGVTDATGSKDSYMLDEDAWIDYTIRFQNTGNAPAGTVVIRDTLAGELDIATLQVIGASHDFTPSFGAGRTLVFTFNNINLPDSTSDFLGSQGSVKFRISPRSGIQAGELIENTADIYFDSNPPVITNTTVHEVAVGTDIRQPVEPSALRIFPNPATDQVLVLLPNGAGQDLRVLAADGRHTVVPAKATLHGALLDIRGLKPGIYIIHTATGTARLIKQ